VYYASTHLIIEQRRLRLMAQQTSDHSPATFDKPRTLNLRNPRTCFIQLKAGSTIAFLLLYNFLPFLVLSFSSIRLVSFLSGAIVLGVLPSRPTETKAFILLSLECLEIVFRFVPCVSQSCSWDFAINFLYLLHHRD